MPKAKLPTTALKLVKLKLTNSKIARVSLRFEILWDSTDKEAETRAWTKVARVMVDLVPPAERADFLKKFKAEVARATSAPSPSGSKQRRLRR
jgi:hypothetical protein